MLADSYKTAHFLQYPASRLMCAYGEFRKRMPGLEDDRVVVYGVRHVVEEYLHTRWTLDDIDNAALFFQTHGSSFGDHAFPRALFERFVRENDGYFPVRFEALLDGTVVHARTPVYQLTARGEYAHLVTYLETLLTHLWYPTCVATLARRVRARVEEAFERSCDDDQRTLVESRLVDYGFSACTGIDQAMIGGCAHLLSFATTANTAAGMPMCGVPFALDFAPSSDPGCIPLCVFAAGMFTCDGGMCVCVCSVLCTEISQQGHTGGHGPGGSGRVGDARLAHTTVRMCGYLCGYPVE